MLTRHGLGGGGSLSEEAWDPKRARRPWCRHLETGGVLIRGEQ